MGGVSSVLNPGQQVPTVVLPDNYQPPRFPSLYDPSVDVTLRQTGVFVYQAEVIWRFTVLWTIILMGGIFFLCSMMAFITSLLSLTILRPKPLNSNPDPFTQSSSDRNNQIASDGERKPGRRRPRKRPPLWPIFLIPIVGCFVGAVLATISGTVVGFVLSAVYSAGGFSMSTWVPFLWAGVQALVLIISSYSTLTSIL